MSRKLPAICFATQKSLHAIDLKTQSQFHSKNTSEWLSSKFQMPFYCIRTLLTIVHFTRPDILNDYRLYALFRVFHRHTCMPTYHTSYTYYDILLYINDTYNYYFIIFGIYTFNVKKFCDWFSEIKMISVHDSFFWKMIYYLNSIVIIDHHKASSYRWVATPNISRVSRATLDFF